MHAGQTVGRWTLIEYAAGNSPRTHKGADRIRPKWYCRCECGTMAWVLADNLRRAGKSNGTLGCRACAKLGRKPLSGDKTIPAARRLPALGTLTRVAAPSLLACWSQPLPDECCDARRAESDGSHESEAKE